VDVTRFRGLFALISRSPQFCGEPGINSMKSSAAAGPGTQSSDLDLLTFADLVFLKIVGNRVTLGRWTKKHGFPPAIHLGDNTVRWRRSAVLAWIAEREKGGGHGV
jgi:hypothetical protein